MLVRLLSRLAFSLRLLVLTTEQLLLVDCIELICYNGIDRDKLSKDSLASILLNNLCAKLRIEIIVHLKFIFLLGKFGFVR
jgi:hypothetical protein